MTAGDVWHKFGRWRRRRPFWGALFLLLSGGELFYTANATLAGLSLHLGPTGFLSYLLPLMLIVCGLLCLFTPAQRLFYGIVALLTALYSFIGLNLGGFFVGMLLGIIGGALVIAWGPPRIRPVNPAFVPIADQVALEQEASDTTEIKSPSAETAPGEEPPSAGAPTEHIEIAGHDDRPGRAVRPPATSEPDIVPGFGDDQEGPKSGSTRSRLSRNPKALTVALIVTGLTAALLAVGSRVPASAAADCPSGLPSRSATASSSSAAADPAAAGSAAKKALSGTATGAKKTATGAGRATSGTTTSKAGTPAPTTSPSKDKNGNPIVDGVKGIVGGIGNLLGLGGGDSSSAPSTSPAPSPSLPPAPTTTAPAGGHPAPSKTTPAGTTPASPGSASSAGGTPSSAAPSAQTSEIPCLGARMFGLNADGDGIPLIADKPGKLETDSLQMFDSTYDGVVNLPTGGGGSARVLKFSMTRAVNKPFSLTVDEASGAQTVITSNELTTAGDVKFFTQRFEGKLFGVIPVVFTPESPPPLTLPYLWFTDVTIQLNYVQCNTLTGFPLHIKEK